MAKRFGVHMHEFRAWRMGRYTSLRTPKYLLYPFSLRRMVEASARQHRFDLLFSQHTISAVAAGWLKRSQGIPVVMNFLDYLTGFMETWPAYLAPPPMLRWLKDVELRLPVKYQADAVLTVSDTLADHFADAGYPRARLRPIYYGYDADLFKPATGGGTDAKNPVVVMHGSFDHHHLGPIALGALVHLGNKRPDVTFRFVGQHTPALKQFLRRVAALSPGLKTECAGFVPYREIARHLADATVGIVPYEESTGTHCAFVAKTVEYLGVGLPVVSTPLDSARRYYKQEPAVRFSGFDGLSFGETILSWLNEPAARRRELGLAASARVRAQLDWRAVSRRAVDFVEDACGRHGAEQPDGC